MKRPWPRRLRFRLEAFGAGLMFGLFRLLPLAAASNLGGWLARTVGPRLGVSNRARSNLSRRMPELSPEEIESAVREMWDNLGRLVAEWPHLREFRLADEARNPGDIEVIGAEYIAGRGNGHGAVLLYGAHLGNWEAKSTACRLLGIGVHGVFRAANNPYVDAIMSRLRSLGAVGTVPKGAGGAKKLISLIRDGEAIGLLVDQKMNDGIMAPFFKAPAMTAPALAQLALRHNVPMIGMRCERLGCARFRMTFLPPLVPPDSGNRQQDVIEVMTRVNAILEDWIRERPGQWLWLHRRWPD